MIHRFAFGAAIGTALLWATSGLYAADSEAELYKQMRKLDQQIQNAKTEAVNLSVEMDALERDILFPKETRMSIFVTMEVFTFDIESVNIQVDGETIATKKYDAMDNYALRRGGVQRVFLGNIDPGVHTLDASFSGKFGGDDADQPVYERSVTVSFTKSPEPQSIELRVDTSRGRELTYRVFQRKEKL